MKSPKTGREITFDHNFGSTLEEAVEKFGAEGVHSVFAAQATIRAQGAARSVLDKDDKSAEDALNAGTTYVPGVVRRSGRAKSDPVDVLANKVKSGEVSMEDLMAELQKRLDSGA